MCLNAQWLRQSTQQAKHSLAKSHEHVPNGKTVDTNFRRGENDHSLGVSRADLRMLVWPGDFWGPGTVGTVSGSGLSV